jgi:hypothetical protein
MTGYTVHTGSTEDFAAGWDQIFKKTGRSKSKPAKSKPGARKAPKKAIAKASRGKGKSARKK